MENLVGLQEIYRGKKVLVTGHTGFKGTWLSCILHRLGAQVYGYALAPTNDASDFFALFPNSQFESSTISDIRDLQHLKSLVRDVSPDFIFHLAAQPLVLESYNTPAATFDVNVTGTANILEAVRDLESKCTVLVITTDKVYDNKEIAIAYSEDDALGGYDPYSASKACAELVVNSFRNSFFNPAIYPRHQKAVATVRAGNVIGGGDWSPDRIIPDTVRSLIRDQPVIVRNPSAVRPWQHVLEPLAGYLMLAGRIDKEPAAFSKPFNFGPLPGDHLQVQDLVALAIKAWGKGTMETSAIAQPHEANLLMLDISRAQSLLNWQPRLTATEAIQWTLAWYKAQPEKRAEFTFDQIEQYFSL